MKEGSKYFPLYSYLQQSDLDEVTLTLSQIETILGVLLPVSARRQRAWWSNRSKGAVQSHAWMQAGYHVESINLTAGEIVFRKPKLVYEAKQVGGTVRWDGELIAGLRRHMAFTQEQLADFLGVRQQTISEWERGVYEPSRATSKYLSMVAEQKGFSYTVISESS